MLEKLKDHEFFKTLNGHPLLIEKYAQQTRLRNLTLAYVYENMNFNSVTESLENEFKEL